MRPTSPRWSIMSSPRADGGTRARRNARRRGLCGAGGRLMPQPDLLLIEDDEAIAELIVWHFAREGFSVRPTPDGEQAPVTVEVRVPDIVRLAWMIETVPASDVSHPPRRNPHTATA